VVKIIIETTTNRFSIRCCRKFVMESSNV